MSLGRGMGIGPQGVGSRGSGEWVGVNHHPRRGGGG